MSDTGEQSSTNSDNTLGATTDSTVSSVSETTTPLGPDGKPFDPDRAMRTIEHLRSFETQAKEQAKMIAELESKVKEHEDAKLSETERLTNRVSELEAEKQTWEQTRVSMMLEQAAARAGAAHPNAIPRLVDLSAVKYERDGTPRNLDELIEKAKTEYPAMFGRSASSFDGGMRGTHTSDNPDEIFQAFLRGDRVQ